MSLVLEELSGFLNYNLDPHPMKSKWLSGKRPRKGRTEEYQETRTSQTDEEESSDFLQNLLRSDGQATGTNNHAKKFAWQFCPWGLENWYLPPQSTFSGSRKSELIFMQ